MGDNGLNNMFVYQSCICNIYYGRKGFQNDKKNRRKIVTNTAQLYSWCDHVIRAGGFVDFLVFRLVYLLSKIVRA